MVIKPDVRKILHHPPRMLTLKLLAPSQPFVNQFAAEQLKCHAHHSLYFSIQYTRSSYPFQS